MKKEQNRMKIKKYIKKTGLLCILLMLVTIVSACGRSNEQEEIIYSKGIVSFTETYGGAVYNSSKELGTCASVGDVNYHFAAEISETRIEDYIRLTGQIMEIMQADAATFGGKSSDEDTESKYEIYVCNVAYTPTVEDNCLYVSIFDMGKPEHFSAVAQLIFGRHVNYGLLYGYAVNVAQELNYKFTTGDLEEALSLRESNPSYLDMNYPCFMNSYVGNIGLEKIKTIAVNYYKYLEDEGKTDILTAYTNKKQREYFNGFLTDNKKEPYDNSDMDNIYVYTSGNALRFIWEDPNATYHLEKEFVVNTIMDCFEVDMYNSGYNNLRELMVMYETQTIFVKEKMLPYGVKERRANIYFNIDEVHAAGHGGVCWSYALDSYEDTIHVYNAISVPHEYIHFLIDFSTNPAWMQECVTRYYTYYPENYENSYHMQDARHYDYWGRAKEDAIIVQRLGHEIDWTSRADYEYYIHALTSLHSNYRSLTDGATGNEEKQSFTFFLIDKVGEKEAIQALISGDAESTFGQSWDELIEEWIGWIRTKFV